MKRWSWTIGTLILIFFMYAIAEWSNNEEFIFPAMSAITIGTWLYTNKAWTQNLLLLWLSPTIAAIIGIETQLLFPNLHTIFIIMLVYILTAGMLYLLNSYVTPSLAAALLPVLLEVKSWYFVLSVLIFSGIVTIVKVISTALHTKHNPSPNRTAKLKIGFTHRRVELLHWLFVGIFLMCFSLLAFTTNWKFIIAPPLIVTLYEFTKLNSVLKTQPIRLVILMFISSMLGALCFIILYQYFHLSLSIVACGILFFILIFFSIIKLPFPPSAAIALLPTIIPLENMWLYPLQITLGTSMVVLGGLFYHHLFSKWKVHQELPI